MQSDDTDLPLSVPPGFTQWSADNIDHNVCPIDGRGTFHGMRIISMTSRNSAANLVNGHFTGNSWTSMYFDADCILYNLIASVNGLQ